MAKPTIRIGTSDRNEKYVMAPANWLPSRSPYRVIAAIRCLTLLCDAIRLPRRINRPISDGFGGIGACAASWFASFWIETLDEPLVPAMGPPGSDCTSTLVVSASW